MRCCAQAGDLAELLLHAAGEGVLPDAWRSASSTALQGALAALDPVFSGYVDWRELVACLVGTAFPAVLQATCADLADQCEVSQLRLDHPTR